MSTTPPLPKWRDPTDPANYPPRARTHHHYLAAAVKFSPAAIKREMAQVEGFNAKLAVLVTRGVGTMACAYLFAVLAISGFPAAMRKGGIGFSNWLAEEFLQLVLLSIIMVGQIVLAKASDARAEKQAADTIAILDEVRALRGALAERTTPGPRSQAE
jgi:hypothetical protein